MERKKTPNTIAHLWMRGERLLARRPPRSASSSECGFWPLTSKVRHLEVINHRRHGRRAETVVDIDDRHARGAAVQHAEQGGDAAEARAVADARRHGDHRYADEAGDDAWQRPFHA